MPEEMELHKLKVGKEYDLFNEKEGLRGTTGCILEADWSGGFILGIYMDNMTKIEEEMLRLPIQVRLFKDAPEFILSLLRYGTKGSTFEMSFDPLLYKDERKETILKGNMMTIIGVESTTNIIRTLRYVNMPRKLYLSLITQYEEAKKIDNYSEKYSRWYDDLQKRYSTDDLWKMSTYIGKMGEEKLGL